MIVVFLCKGTLGDVAPVFSVAQQLREVHPSISCAFVTHTSHLKHFQNNADKSHIRLTPLNVPVKRDYCSSEDPEVEKHERVKEMHLSREACDRADALVFNLFACEGWFIAQSKKIPSTAVSPFLIARSPPASFECHFKEAFPTLVNRLKTAENGQVSYGEVEHWMWRLYLDDFGQFCEDLNIPVCPYIDASPDGPLPPPTPLLYGQSPTIVERQPYWPSSVVLCGYWFADSLDTSYSQSCLDSVPVQSPSLVQGRSSHQQTLKEFFQESEQKPVFLGFGSMEDLGCFADMDCLLFLRLINKCVGSQQRKVLLHTIPHCPLYKAWEILCEETSQDCVIHCLDSFVPHSAIFINMYCIIHHGGSGTVGTALRAGVPQIICPILFDQSFWAEKVEWLGVGVGLSHPRSLHEEQLIDALDKVSLKDTLEKVKAYSEDIRTENGALVAVCELTKCLRIEHLLKNCSSKPFSSSAELHTEIT